MLFCFSFILASVRFIFNKYSFLQNLSFIIGPSFSFEKILILVFDWMMPTCTKIQIKWERTNLHRKAGKNIKLKNDDQDIIFKTVNFDIKRGLFSNISCKLKISDTQNSWLRTSIESLSSISRKSFLKLNNCVKFPCPTPIIHHSQLKYGQVGSIVKVLTNCQCKLS